MKILFYNHTGQVSGAENMLLLILARLDRAKFRRVVVCPADGGLRQKVEQINVDVKPIDVLQARFTSRPDLIMRYLASFFRTMLDFRKIVAREQPDLIHANSTRAGLVATAATIGLPTRIVWHLHDVLPAHPLSTAIRLFASCFRRVSMIAVSRAVAAAFRGRIPARWLDVAVIHNAIETNRFVRDQAGADKLRAELNLSRDATVFGIVGQITPRKGHLELIHAFAEAARTIPNAALLIVGASIFNRDHEYQQQLVDAAERLGIGDKVHFLGKRSDIATVFSALDVLILNSRNEPFGLVLVEAMAVGTPVLAVAVDGVPEIVEHNETGWLVPTKDQSALTAALIALSQQPELRRKLGEKGRNHALTNFKAERYIETVEKYFDSLLNQ